MGSNRWEGENPESGGEQPGKLFRLPIIRAHIRRKEPNLMEGFVARSGAALGLSKSSDLWFCRRESVPHPHGFPCRPKALFGMSQTRNTAHHSIYGPHIRTNDEQPVRSYSRVALKDREACVLCCSATRHQAWDPERPQADVHNLNRTAQGKNLTSRALRSHGPSS